jgi:hypothetical protein
MDVPDARLEVTHNHHLNAHRALQDVRHVRLQPTELHVGIANL